MEPEGFATTLCLGILDARFAVCGGEEIAIDRWYHRLLVLLLVFLLSLHAHSLFKSRDPFPSFFLCITERQKLHTWYCT